MATNISRRTLFGYGGALTGVALLGVACTGGETPLPPPVSGGDPAALESPMLAQRVKAGTLPPLDQRLPAKPMIVKPLQEAGRFGGTLRRAQTSAASDTVTVAFCAAGLVEWTLDIKGAQPSLAESYTRSDDNRVYTFVVREGLKWSDGQPFTAQDVADSIQHFFGNKLFNVQPPVYMSDGGKLPKVDIKDGRTLTISFEEPSAMFEKFMCHPGISIQLVKPWHYLKQFHIDLAETEDDKAKVEAAAKAAGFDSWDMYFLDRDDIWKNPERPVMGAYIVTKPAGAQSGTAEFERNPYYFKTDPDGRQLPYIDKIQVQMLEQDALDLRAANGDLDFQAQFLGYSTTQVYLRNAEARGFKVLRWEPGWSLLSINPNLSHKDPVLRKLFLDKRVRFALSHAINREEINKTLLGGLGVLRQPVSTEAEPYYTQGDGDTALAFDLAKANALLDEAGLTERDAAGTRLRPDGKPFELVITFIEDNSEVPRTDAFEAVRRHWAAAGVKLALRPVDKTLYAEVRSSNDFDLDGVGTPENSWDIEPVWYVPTASNSHFAPAYGNWYASKGKAGDEPPAEIKELMDLWDTMATATSDQERIEAGKKIMTAHDRNLYIIGIVRLPFQPVVVNAKLRNVRDDKPPMLFHYGREGVTKPEQLYFA
ncbi:ABC transporter substrate-binding protein [Nonomuraea aridisoli]|uniref:Solute-binding protein family 5 domain-containing protein n=1 Tax=Nonomuraea aridisoli TaxID=2070368 RepID=A0A2W2EDA7_9ACTN|nr:ABC transporter substrate-binding protein [Nonomuraea aridisoli]PZG20493.1 hypothetical protein C1J01_09110 [Nonomuraea aridisoli]